MTTNLARPFHRFRASRRSVDGGRDGKAEQPEPGSAETTAVSSIVDKHLTRATDKWAFFWKYVLLAVVLAILIAWLMVIGAVVYEIAGLPVYVVGGISAVGGTALGARVARAIKRGGQSPD